MHQTTQTIHKRKSRERRLNRIVITLHVFACSWLLALGSWLSALALTLALDLALALSLACSCLPLFALACCPLFLLALDCSCLHLACSCLLLLAPCLPLGCFMVPGPRNPILFYATRLPQRASPSHEIPLKKNIKLLRPRHEGANLFENLDVGKSKLQANYCETCPNSVTVRSCSWIRQGCQIRKLNINTLFESYF